MVSCRQKCPVPSLNWSANCSRLSHLTRLLCLALLSGRCPVRLLRQRPSSSSTPQSVSLLAVLCLCLLPTSYFPVSLFRPYRSPPSLLAVLCLCLLPTSYFPVSLFSSSFSPSAPLSVSACCTVFVSPSYIVLPRFSIQFFVLIVHPPLCLCLLYCVCVSFLHRTSTFLYSVIHPHRPLPSLLAVLCLCLLPTSYFHVSLFCSSVLTVHPPLCLLYCVCLLRSLCWSY